MRFTHFVAATTPRETSGPSELRDLIQNGSMPVEMVRAVLTGQAPSRDFKAAWRFALSP